MTTMRPRAGWVVAGIGLLAMVGLATLAALFSAGEGDRQALSGEVRIVESQMARFDRQVHAAVLDPGTELGDVDVGLCLELADAVDVAPGHSVVLYDPAGTVIGEGTLGQPEQSIDESRPAYADHVVCRLPFRVGEVQRTDAVRIDIGSRTRATYDTASLDESRLVRGAGTGFVGRGPTRVSRLWNMPCYVRPPERVESGF